MYSIHSNNSCINNTPFSFILLEKGCVHNLFTHAFVVDGTEGILSKDQLRNSKNMFIAGITLFTRAAIDGGVPEETAYSLSDGYIQTVEECTNSVSIEKLSQRAAARFAQEVYDPRKRMEMIPYLVTSRNIC